VKAHAVEKLHIQEERITVVERGRDPARLGRPSRERRERARRSLGLTDDDEVVVTLGREEYQKGQRYLLEAVAAVAARRPQLVGLLAGKAGSESERLRAWHAGSGLGDRFRFLGHRDDAPELLAAADLFVLPSLFEGFSGVLIEAMALGLPIVASDIPAIREVVEPGRNAVLVDPASSEALVTGIESLLDSRVQRQAYGERGRSIFEERFTLERSTSRMVELYRRLAESASASSATAARAEVQ
jgi:glycosyltransferase involved in cell wall biosynthesis